MLLFNPLRHGISRGAATGYERAPAPIRLGPERQATLPEEIFVVEAEFFKAGTCHLRELELHLLGSSTNFASFSNILDATAGSLHHLIVGAAAFVYEAIAKAHSHIIAKLA